MIVTNGTTVRPFDNLPEICDADLVTRIKGRSATVTLGRGTIEMPLGRRLTMANGVFEVPETQGEHPPARVRARIEGPVAAGFDLLSMDRLKDTVGVQLDAATTRGNILVNALHVDAALVWEIKNGTITYAINADIVNFSADRFLMSQKVELQMLRAVANNQGYQIRGDMRIGGVPATAEMRRNSGDADAEIKLQATLDDAARNRLGWDTAGNLIGPVASRSRVIDLGGEQENRFAVEADFTRPRSRTCCRAGSSRRTGRRVRPSPMPAARGAPAASTTSCSTAAARRSAAAPRPTPMAICMVANFPVLGMSDGDKATLRVERTPDNVYKATVRGDVYDGRSFIKSSMAGSGADAKQKSRTSTSTSTPRWTVVGLKGESLRNVDLHMTKRGGSLRALSLNAKIGDGTLTGEMRGRPSERPSSSSNSATPGRCSASPTPIRACSAARPGLRWTRRTRRAIRRKASSTSPISR